MMILFLNKILGLLALFLFIFGIIGNLLTFFVCRRKSLKKITVFRFLMIISINDIFALSVWNLDIFLLAFFNYSHEYLSWWWCKISIFVQYFCLQYSAWLLVFLSVDRYLNIRITLWRKIYSIPKNAKLFSIILGFLIFLINSHLLIVNGYTIQNNSTKVVKCYSPEFFFDEVNYIPFWHKVHVYLYSLVPIFILLVVNSLLIYQSLNPIKLTGLVSKRRKQKSKTLTYSIVSMTVLFFFSSLPYSIITAYWYFQLMSTQLGQFFLNALSLLSFSYHAFNFIVFFLTNVKFWNECKIILKRK